ncbi:NADP-dependent isocitrate dehydrogenase [Candidatus Comchoanobacter bicostacola]|uniref:Isocitrate dehydrogenase [NADP] n=1 Tax=Candidatus Comchoanobacter bicostacola TaxID=2919598 RepID=A0ABY5DID6_9GAMM|nr:NADP-dependent isocitrate dehydrogenase [Candidatus Comchoanobacter bicostacola]UTC24164.1 NADP-dependent isocitrate dehydrogenase [Candidatus Comchoanobacter bicostacola]
MNERSSSNSQYINVQSSLAVPSEPVVAYITGDGIGSDITPVMIEVVNAACKKAYGEQRKIDWQEVYAGQKAFDLTGEWLPKDTLDAIQRAHIAIKGPLATPIGGGIRSLNVALRHQLKLNTCMRPVRYFDGVPSPLKKPESVDIVVFRENSEDIYSGIEFKAGDALCEKLISDLKTVYSVSNIHYPKQSGLGVKVISEPASKALVRRAIQFAIDQNRKKVALVHKGNIMKYTEGAFCHWGYEVVVDEFGGEKVGGFYEIENPHTQEIIQVEDIIADACFQHVLLRPESFDVIATMNLNGDYLSDALAAQVGGIGIAPGANIGDTCALFEATHGTAPKHAGKNKANPSSLILSAEMMLRHMGWTEAADYVLQGVENAINDKQLTYDFARFYEGVDPISTSAYGQAICKRM